MVRIGDGDMLGVIDVQPTFMPGGELPVPDGEAVVPLINALLPRFAGAFATQDWHPPGHSSFASAHEGRAPFDVMQMPYGPQTLWPDHALQDTPGAALHPGLDTRRVELVLRKGFRPGIDSYSAFRDNDGVTETGLEAWLRARGVRRLFLAGLALDYCVGWSAADAAALGFEVTVVADCCRGLGPADTATERLLKAGVTVATAGELAASG